MMQNESPQENLEFLKSGNLRVLKLKAAALALLHPPFLLHPVLFLGSYSQSLVVGRCSPTPLLKPRGERCVIEALSADKAISLITDSPSTKLLLPLPRLLIAPAGRLYACLPPSCSIWGYILCSKPFMQTLLSLAEMAISVEIFMCCTCFRLFNLWTGAVGAGAVPAGLQGNLSPALVGGLS